MANVDRSQSPHGRVYYDVSGTYGPKRPSVTNLLNQLDEDTTGLEIWQSRNDGHGDNAFHEHLFWYKQHRGTLAHSAALSTVTSKPLWGEDEASSLEAIESQKYDVNTLYSVVKDHENGSLCNDMSCDGECDICVNTEAELPQFRRQFTGDGLANLMDVHWHDIQYVRETFSDIADALGITQASTIAAEQMFVNHEIGYGGQVDLAYEDKNGDVVVSDLKTSSGCRHKHRVQAVAYKNALENELDIDVDRIEVIRIHPESRTWKVHTPTPKYDVHTDDIGWDGHWGEADATTDWVQFKQLAEQHDLNGDLYAEG